jgi:transmembrane sensor
MDNLFVKYVMGEATAEEQQKIQHLMDIDGDVAEKVWQLRAALELSDTLKLGASPDSLRAYGRFQERIGAEGGIAYRIRPGRVRPRVTLWRWAAIFIGLLALSAAGYMAFHPDRITVTRAGLYRLPDGSTVELGSGAGLTYDRKFEERVVVLGGNGFFDISPNTSKPFMVRVNELVIKVLGTSFMVRDMKDSTIIDLKTGVVSVSRGGDVALVKAGEVLKVYRSSMVLSVDTVPAISPAAPVAPVSAAPVAPAAPTSVVPVAPVAPTSAAPMAPAAPAAGKPIKSQWRPVGAVQPVKKGAVHMGSPYDPKLVFRQIVEEMIKEKLINAIDEVTWFGLDNHQFVINDKSMPDSLLVKFRTMFIKPDGNGYYYGSVKVTGTGYFYNKQDIYGQ